MTEIDVSKLRSLAGNATPGPWAWTGEPGDDEACLDAAGADGYVLSAHGMHTEGFVNVDAPDAEFIAAAHPATVLALLDRLEQAEAAIERATSKHRKMTDDDEPYCLTCYQSPYGHAPWPCPTVAALDTGKEASE